MTVYFGLKLTLATIAFLDFILFPVIDGKVALSFIIQISSKTQEPFVCRMRARARRMKLHVGKEIV